MNPIKILNYQSSHQPYFEAFNRAWIEKYFVMEPLDEWVLTNPDKAILEPGGAILMAEYEGVIAGTVGLRKIDAKTFEFTKMAVDENYRRRGIAEALTYASYRKAWKLGASKIILYSNTRNTGAVELYEKLGFQHMEVEQNVYKRANVKMAIDIETAIRRYHKHIYEQLINE